MPPWARSGHPVLSEGRGNLLLLRPMEGGEVNRMPGTGWVGRPGSRSSGGARQPVIWGLKLRTIGGLPSIPDQRKTGSLRSLTLRPAEGPPSCGTTCKPKNTNGSPYATLRPAHTDRAHQAGHHRKAPCAGALRNAHRWLRWPAGWPCLSACPFAWLVPPGRGCYRCPHGPARLRRIVSYCDDSGPRRHRPARRFRCLLGERPAASRAS